MVKVKRDVKVMVNSREGVLRAILYDPEKGSCPTERGREGDRKRERERERESERERETKRDTSRIEKKKK